MRRARAGSGPSKEEIIEVSAAGMSVQELAAKLACTPADVVKLLFMKGMMVQVNQQLDRPTVKMICEAKARKPRAPGSRRPSGVRARL